MFWPNTLVSSASNVKYLANPVNRWCWKDRSAFSKRINVVIKWTALLFRTMGSRLWTRTSILKFLWLHTILPANFGIAAYTTAFFPSNHSRCILQFHVTRFLSYAVEKQVVKQTKNKSLGFWRYFAVVQLVEAMRYKPKGRRFDARWCHWTFSLTILQAALWPWGRLSLHQNLVLGISPGGWGYMGPVRRPDLTTFICRMS
jgi:hypothetical protein